MAEASAELLQLRLEICTTTKSFLFVCLDAIFSLLSGSLPVCRAPNIVWISRCPRLQLLSGLMRETITLFADVVLGLLSRNAFSFLPEALDSILSTIVRSNFRHKKSVGGAILQSFLAVCGALTSIIEIRNLFYGGTWKKHTLAIQTRKHMLPTSTPSFSTHPPLYSSTSGP